MRRPNRKSLREVVERSSGVVAAVARHYDVTRQTVYSWLDYYDLRNSLQDARDDVLDIAEANIFRAVRAGDLETSKWVLPRLGRQRGWGTNVEVSGVTISHETMKLIEGMGWNAQTVVEEFESLVRMQAMIGAGDVQESD